ncbi:MAG: tetratricopeptide repeat protein [Actinobacteria bacterium]|nr:tetratricopeptide repeat protein [Actinomycetota bacterium]
MADAPYACYLPVCHAAWLGADAGGPQGRVVDATLVFSDVSGFTPLTERLSRLGRVGAERLTDVLNQIMGGLLDVADGYGGDLLKFGGDALLLQFEGPDHAGRAVEAAHAMQRALRPFRRLRTDAGTVSLRMSVGVVSGPVVQVLVGGRHRELLVVGRTVDEVTALESAASPDEVLVGVVDGSGFALDAPAPSPGAGVDIALGVPVALRSYLEGGREDGEHRVVALSFLEADGTSSLLASAGVSAVATAVDGVVRAVQAACERHGVAFLATDLARDGVRILLCAGAPTASPEDDDRVLQVLLDVIDECASSPLSVRAGVNRGRAFAVDVGSERRRTYAVMGDPTNLAARLMSKSAPGTVLAAQSVLGRVRAAYDVEPLPPFLVKGKSLPIEAAVVRRASSASTGEVMADAPLVGREREVALLREVLASAASGRGRVVELVGEPGIGKSRLLAAFLAAGDGLPRFVVEGAPYAATSPYFALRAPLRRLVGLPEMRDDAEVAAGLAAWASRSARDLVPWLPLLAVPFGVDVPDTPTTAEVDVAFRAARTHTLVGDLVHRALTGPALFALEDAHWLDPASSELLTHLLAPVASRPWAVCVTRRDVEGGARLVGDAVTSVVVEPLDDEAVRALLRQVGGPGGAAAAAVIARSGGNPLFLQELVAVGDMEEVPDSIEAVVAARIDTLPRPGRLVLRGAAVLGGRFDDALLASLLDRERASVAAWLGSLDGFLVRSDDGRYAFRHALLREVAYGGLPFRRRRELHGRAGELVQRAAGDAVEEWSDLLSLHYSAAQREPEAWRFSRMAGDRARRSSAPVEAETFYARAVEAARGAGVAPSELAAVYEAMGDVAELSGRYAVARHAYRAARALVADDPLAVVSLCEKEGKLRERQGRYSDALRWYTRAEKLLADVPGDDEAARAVARVALGRGATRLRQGRYRDCIPVLEAAVATASQVGDRRTLANAYYLLDWAYTDLGSDQSAHYRELALPIFEELGDLWRQANVYNNLGINAYYEGRWDEAVDSYRRSRELWQRSGDAVQLASADNNIAEVLSDQGRLDAAEPLFREALAGWAAAPSPAGVGLATCNLGRLAVRAGRFDEGEALLTEARDGFRAIGAEAFLLDASARLAERLVLEGRGPEAEIEEVRRGALRAGGMPVLLSMLDRLDGWAAAQAGRRDEAVVLLRSAVERGTAVGADYEVALAYEALARVAGDDGAAAEAAGRFARLNVIRTPPVPL